jgi:hypothetical protein
MPDRAELNMDKDAAEIFRKILGGQSGEGM